jgi:hydroxymethylglutaryl-CoA reductase (NADPH)
MRWQKSEQIASLPMRTVGPVKIISAEVTDEVSLPLATFETPLWPSVHRGARLCTKAGGIHAVIIDERMTRSILVEADSIIVLAPIVEQIKAQPAFLQTLVQETSRFASLIGLHTQVVGNLLYLRFEFLTGDAAGHNMVTLAADKLLAYLLKTYPDLRYVSLSGNYCADKKVSAVNGLLGRGKNVVADILLTRELCRRYLRVEPEQMVNLHIKKNLLGSIVAGGLRTANAHFANMLLAFYLATGQDAANIIEGSQGFVHAEVRAGNLYFSVSLPNLIVGAVGNGKDLLFVQENLRLLGCAGQAKVGENARRLAVIAAACVLCGELSLLATLSHQDELMGSHVKLERGSKESKETL